jgi:hypothetical protein
MVLGIIHLDQFLGAITLHPSNNLRSTGSPAPNRKSMNNKLIKLLAE